MWLFFFIPKVFSICIEYSCKSNLDNLFPNQCIWSSFNQEGYNLSLSLQLCTDPYFSYCPQVTTNASCQLPPQKPSRNIAYIGEPCNLDENCVTSICLNGICSGLPANSSCSYDTECNTGLYCDTTCTPVKGLYSQCSRDYECLNNLTCLNGKCSNYFSLTSFSKINTCSNQVNLQCSSGGCFTNQGVSYCLPNAKSKGTIPISCVTDFQCNVSLSGSDFRQYSTSCQCSQNGFGLMACSLAPGDGIFVSYVRQLKKWFGSKEVHKCHTTQRLALNCAQNMWDYNDYVTLAYFQAYALNYPKYQYSDNCVKQIFQADFRALQKTYFSLQNKKEESSSFASALICLSSLFFIY